MWDVPGSQYEPVRWPTRIAVGSLSVQVVFGVVADLAAHEELIAIAHDDARLVLERDPQLESERGRALRVLLYLFRRDEAVQYLRAG